MRTERENKMAGGKRNGLEIGKSKMGEKELKRKRKLSKQTNVYNKRYKNRKGKYGKRKKGKGKEIERYRNKIDGEKEKRE